MKLPTERQCQALFDAYNRRFFRGRLPAYRVLLSNQFGTGLHGMCRRKEREIHLGTELRGADLRKRLIHEMAHAASNGGHGALWQAEMRRLKRLSATHEDPDAYSDPAQTITPRQIATGEFYGAGLETNTAWSSARAQIGLMYGLTDDRGRAESKYTSWILRMCRKEFSRGRRERNYFANPPKPRLKGSDDGPKRD
jgi:hypothetical protein